MSDFNFKEGIDYYLEKGSVILTEEYLAKRGKCCSSNCRHCPYEPRATKGNTNLRKKDTNNLDVLE